MDARADKFTRMTTQPVKKLVLRLAGPTIASMLISSLYNMADTFFVGRIGTFATAGVGLIFPLTTCPGPWGPTRSMTPSAWPPRVSSAPS